MVLLIKLMSVARPGFTAPTPGKKDQVWVIIVHTVDMVRARLKSSVYFHSLWKKFVIRLREIDVPVISMSAIKLHKRLGVSAHGVKRVSTTTSKMSLFLGIMSV